MMDDKQLTEEYLDGKVVFPGKIIRVEHWRVRLPNGPEKREVDDADEQEESTEPEILRDEDFDDNVLEDEEE